MTDQQHPSSSLSEVRRLANEYKLGVLQQSFLRSDVSGVRLLINAFVWIGFTLFGLVGIFFLEQLIFALGAPGDESTVVKAILVALVCLLFLGGCLRQGVLHLFEYRQRQHEQVHVFREGFVYLERTGKSRIYRWDDIRTFQRGTLDPHKNGQIILDCLYLEIWEKHSSTHEFDTLDFEPLLANRSAICDCVEKTYTDYLLPQALEKYRKGQEVSFGKLFLSQKGVRRYLSTDELMLPEKMDNACLAWQDVVSFRVSDDYTTVMARTSLDDHPWFRNLTPYINDASLLKALLAATDHEDFTYVDLS